VNLLIGVEACIPAAEREVGRLDLPVLVVNGLGRKGQLARRSVALYL
jgi:hypothetical protein